MRVILGNDTAIKAIAENHINPWPDGTTFAKVAWFERDDGQGQVRPGAFFQVEFMIRDSRKYAATKGWGWARWRGAGPDSVRQGRGVLRRVHRMPRAPARRRLRLYHATAGSSERADWNSVLLRDRIGGRIVELRRFLRGDFVDQRTRRAYRESAL